MTNEREGEGKERRESSLLTHTLVVEEREREDVVIVGGEERCVRP